MFCSSTGVVVYILFAKKPSKLSFRAVQEQNTVLSSTEQYDFRVLKYRYSICLRWLTKNFSFTPNSAEVRIRTGFQIPTDSNTDSNGFQLGFERIPVLSIWILLDSNEFCSNPLESEVESVGIQNPAKRSSNPIVILSKVVGNKFWGKLAKGFCVVN